jgi:hypothetical protein
VNELPVNSNTQRGAQPQRYEQSSSRNGNGCLDISFHHADVDFQADKEQEDNKTDRACQVKERD